MNKLLLISFFSLLLFSCNMRRSDKLSDDAGVVIQQEEKNRTTILVDKPNFNFDTAIEGTKIAHNFNFKNTGLKPLIIIKALPSCGCTIAEKPEYPILPGSVGSIKIIFNTEGKIGHNQKTITVSSNAYPPFPSLTLSGEVIKPIK